jgi:hypothetical protein
MKQRHKHDINGSVAATGGTYKNIHFSVGNSTPFLKQSDADSFCSLLILTQQHQFK